MMNHAKANPPIHFQKNALLKRLFYKWYGLCQEDSMCFDIKTPERCQVEQGSPCRKSLRRVSLCVWRSVSEMLMMEGWEKPAGTS